MPRTVGVDFDGVIHAYSKGWQDGSIYDDPVPGAIEGVARLQRTYAVFVLTSRDPDQVSRWLAQRGVTTITDAEFEGGPPKFWTSGKLVLVTNRKLPAVAYVDDRAVVFTNWEQLRAQIAGAVDGNFGPPCCSGHGRVCEQGGDECCPFCTEAKHFELAHGGVLCSSPDLSGTGT